MPLSPQTPKDKARSAREQAQVELDAIYRSAPIGLCLLDTDTRYLRVNQRFADIDGFTIAEHIGKRVRDLIPDLADAAEALTRKVVETGEPILDIEISGETPAQPGAARYWKESWWPLKDDHGRVMAINIVAEEITERKRAEEAIAAAYRQFQSIIDNTPAIVYAFDLEERFVIANTTVAELFNSTPEQMIGKRRHEFMPKEDADWHEANDRKAIEAGRALEFEEYSQLKGRSITWLTTKFPLRDTQGRIYAVAGISADITERKKAEEAVKESAEKFHSVFEHTPLGMALGDMQGRIIESNTVLEQILGYTKDELRNKPFAEITHPEDTMLEWPLIQKLMAGETDHYEIEKRYIRKDGEIIWIWLNGSLVRGRKGEPKIGIAIIQDITERKQAEAERESLFRTITDERALLQSVLEQLPVGVIIAEAPSGNLILTNQRMKDIWGVPFRHQGSVLQDWEYRGFHLDWRPYEIEEWPLARSLTTGEVVLGEEIEILRGDGTQGAVRVSSAPVQDATGTVRYGVVVFVDITGRKQAEEALKESQQRFVTLFHHIPSAISLAKLPDGTIVDVNQAWVDLFGYSRDEAVGRTSTDLGIIRDPEGRKQLLADMQQQRSIRNLESTFYTKTGTAHTILSNMDAITLGGKQYLLSTMQDITERKRAEEALKERDKQLRNLIERSKDGIIITDEAGRITVWNQGMEDITGLTPREVLGEPAWEVQSRLVEPEWAGPDYRARYRATWEAVLRGGAYQYSDRLLDVQIRTPKGDVRYIQQSIFTTPTRRGFHVGSILRDMTTQRRSEEELKKTIEDLRRSNEDLERFAYISSHDLQEPIRTMVTFTQLLERRYKGRLDPDADEYIQYLVNGGKRMQCLIQDLLEFSRVNTTGGEFRPTSATAIVEDALAVLHSKAQENRATITYDPLPRVMADATQLQQVFENLISNAIKFRKPNVPPEIHISAKKQEDMVQFSVADNGIGIEPQYYDRIFVIFQRLHGMDQYEGTGIGLAIVKRIIDRHGGRIRVESEPGKGSTFHFTIPLAKPT